MTQDEICAAIAGSVPLLMEERNHNFTWIVLPRLLGDTGEGPVVVVRVLDTDKGLSRDTAMAADGWRRKKLSELSAAPADEELSQISSEAIETARCASIPAHVMQGISKVLFAG